MAAKKNNDIDSASTSLESTNDPSLTEAPAPDGVEAQPTLEPVNKPEENVVEDGSTRTGLHPMDLYDQGVGGDYTIAPGGGAGPGSGPVDVFGNAINVDRGLDPTSDAAKQTNQKLNQHPADPKAARTEDPGHYQPDVRDARAREAKAQQAEESGAPLDRQADQGTNGSASGTVPPTAEDAQPLV